MRAFWKDKTFSFLNVTGLSIGICSCVLILLWVIDETTFDHFFPNHHRIYQVKVNSQSNGTVNTTKALCLPLCEKLKSEDPRIIRTAFTGWTYGHSLMYDNKILQKEVLAVSEEFLDIFQLTFIHGSAETVFKDPYSIILSVSAARDVFGNEDPINKIITFDNSKDLKVTGVFQDLPDNSSFWFHAMVPITFYEETEQWITKSENDWSYFEYQLYVETQEGADEQEVNARIKNVLHGKFPSGSNNEIFLHPMDRWHLYGKFENGHEAGGNIEYVQLFSAISILSLLIACLNYMNLVTARSERRAKEVGIRKSIGSSRKELVVQFLAESFIVTLLSFLLGILLVELALPHYGDLVHKGLSIDYSSYQFWIVSIVFVLGVSLLSGIYPALYFSAFQPIKVLKGTFAAGKKTILPREISVGAQYLFAIFLFIGTVVIYQQIEYVKQRQPGYNKDDLLMIPTNDEMIANYVSIKDELISSGIARSVTKSNQPITGAFWSEPVNWSGKPADEKIEFTSVSADFEYVKTMGIRIVEGRDFSIEFATDSSAILINRKAAAIMGFENPVGERITLRDSQWTIIGIVDDVLMGSPYESVDPLFIAPLGDWNNYITVRLSKTKNVSESVNGLDAVFKKYNPSNILEKIFVDEEFRYKFRDIQLSGILAKLFSGLALLITCLGVFGLAAYTAESRTKEMAIRKVFGARSSNLLFLMCSNFTKIILVASAIAIPISVFFMETFLQKYSYRVSFQWWILPLVLFYVLLITFIVVCFPVIKAVRVNAVESLKVE
ncbi:MAG TPA: ABC transporter permease [Chryseosolibacter sp.]|nr:ABC transporter permease [Chryseosolibacter sp.]